MAGNLLSRPYFPGEPLDVSCDKNVTSDRFSSLAVGYSLPTARRVERHGLLEDPLDIRAPKIPALDLVGSVVIQRHLEDSCSGAASKNRRRNY